MSCRGRERVEKGQRKPKDEKVIKEKKKTWFIFLVPLSAEDHYGQRQAYCTTDVLTFKKTRKRNGKVAILLILESKAELRRRGW